MANIIQRIERMLFGATAEERVAIMNATIDQHIDRAISAAFGGPETPEELEAELRAYDIAAAVRSLQAIPHYQLPDDEARTELIRRAQAGEEVYAYIPANGGDQYVVWVRCENPDNPENPDHDCRYVPVAWAEAWRAASQQKRQHILDDLELLAHQRQGSQE